MVKLGNQPLKKMVAAKDFHKAGHLLVINGLILSYNLYKQGYDRRHTHLFSAIYRG